MSNTEAVSPKGGFLRRLFAKAEPEQVSAPRASVEAITGVQQVAGKRLAKSKTVLMICATDGASRRWRGELEQWGYGVENTDNGVKGLDILYGFAFDALLIDLQAPNVEGLEMLREIRGHDELKGMFIGVFVQDREGASEQEMSAIEAGANRVFQRATVKPDEILTALKTALFPRILQAQPRSRQEGLLKASPAARPAAPPANGGSIRPSVPINLAAENVGGAAEPAGALKKILIIDGDESVAGIYRAQIEAAGYEVEVALDGETGFHDLYTINPDALLLDLLLPGGLSGSEILKKTRAQRSLRKRRSWCSRTSIPATWRRRPRPRARSGCSTRRRPPRAT